MLANGEYFIADISITPLLADGDSACGFTVIVQDITAKRSIADRPGRTSARAHAA